MGAARTGVRKRGCDGWVWEGGWKRSLPSATSAAPGTKRGPAKPLWMFFPLTCCAGCDSACKYLWSEEGFREGGAGLVAFAVGTEAPSVASAKPTDS